MAGALEGLRVIDFGQYIAGPLTTMFLADHGADVIRVDPPGGPRYDVPANATWNRGKRSICLDLKKPTDVETARRLVQSSDIVVENFRPTVMDRLGLGAEEMMAANSRLIYCSMPGFASDDPRAQMPGWEGVICAATGLFRASAHATPQTRPSYSALPYASSYAALQAVIAIVMAVTARDRDGVGQKITMPLLDGMFGLIGNFGVRLHVSKSAPATDAAFSRVLTAQYQCQDGRWIMLHAGNTRSADVFRAIGAESWANDGLLDHDRLQQEMVRTKNATHILSASEHESLQNDPGILGELWRRACALFKTRPAEEWERLVNEAGGECAVCRTSAEWMNLPHVRQSHTVVELYDPVLGPVRQPGIGAKLSLTQGAIAGPRRALDADRASILAELAKQSTANENCAGGGTQPVAQEASRPPLEGVRVLDLCIILAGPTCGRTLAEYGANVIKIEPPSHLDTSVRNPYGSSKAARGAAPHIDVNRGKRSIVLDLKTKEGMEAFWRLVDQADVITQNFRKGVAERLGIGYEQVRARRPNIIYASFNAYGQNGPFAARAGHEQIAQAATGMQERCGGDGPPELQSYPINDYGTGFFGAQAVAMALRHLRRTGEGQHVDSSLAYTATMLQSPFMIDFEGKRWDEPRGKALGSNPLHRAYEASDGWIFIGLKTTQLPQLDAIAGMRGVAGMTGTSLEAALEQRFRDATIAAWIQRLAAVGIAAQPVVTDVHKLMQDPWLIEHGLSETREHPGYGVVTTPGPPARLSRTPVIRGLVAQPVGMDTAAVLASVGLGNTTG